MTDHKLVLGGLLVAFEGIDGSGKTTSARLCVEALNHQGYSAISLREPTDGPFGRQLRQIMTCPDQRNPQAEFELFLKDRQEDVTQNIQPALAGGQIVCIDRYYISSMAYQGALGISPELIQTENEKFAPPPDLILYFDVPMEVALRRIYESRPDGANQFEKLENLKKVQSIFKGMEFPQMVHINAGQPLEAVVDDCMKQIAAVIAKKTSN